jgi:hypothetical protein
VIVARADLVDRTLPDAREFICGDDDDVARDRTQFPRSIRGQIRL